MAAFISYIYRFLDGCAVLLFSYNLMGMVKIVITSGLDSLAGLVKIDNISSMIMNFAVAVYIVIRAHHYYHNAKLDREHKREDLKEKKRKNQRLTKIQ